MDRLVCGDVGFGKTEVAIRAAFKAVQEGKQVAVLVPTTLLAQQHGQTFGDRFAGYPVRVEVLSRFLTTGRRPAGRRGGPQRRGRRRHRHPPAAVGGRRVQGPRAAGGRRGAALRRQPQGADQADPGRRRRAHAHRHADPADARDEPHRHPRPDAPQHAAGRPPADPHLRRRLRRAGRRPRRSAASCCARARSSSSTTGWQDIEATADHVRELVPEARIAVAHGQMDEGTLEQVVIDFCDGEYDVLVCTTIIESGIDMPTVNTLVVDRADLLGLGQLHQLRGPRRPGRAAGLRLPLHAARPRPQRGGLRAPAHDRRVHRAGLGLQDRHARPRDPRRRQPARHRAVRPHRRGGLRPLLPDGQRGGGRAEGRAGAGAGRDQAGPAPRTPTCRRSTCPRRSCASRPTGAWPRHHPARGGRHPGRVGGPLRPPAPGGRRPARRGPPPGRGRPRRGHRGHGGEPATGSGSSPSTARLSPLACPRQPADPPAAAPPEGDLQGDGRAPGQVAEMARSTPPKPSSPSSRARSAGPLVHRVRLIPTVSAPCSAACSLLAVACRARAEPGCAADVAPAVTIDGDKVSPGLARRGLASAPTTGRLPRRAPGRAQPGRLPAAARVRDPRPAHRPRPEPRRVAARASRSPTRSASRPWRSLFQGDMRTAEQALGRLQPPEYRAPLRRGHQRAARRSAALGEAGVHRVARPRPTSRPTSRSAPATAAGTGRTAPSPRPRARPARRRRRLPGPVAPPRRCPTDPSWWSGLGPAGPELLTAGTLAAIERIPHRLLRTTRHPAAVAVPRGHRLRRRLRGRGHDRRGVRGDRRGRASRRPSSTARCSTPCPARRWWPSAPSSCSWPTPTSTSTCCPRSRSSTWPGPGSASTRSPLGVRLVDGHDFAVEAAGAPGPLLVGQCDQRPRAVRHQALRRRRARRGGAPAPGPARRGRPHGGLGRPRPGRRARPPHLALDPAAGRARGRRGRRASPSSCARCGRSARGTASRPTSQPDPPPPRGDLRGPRRHRPPRRRGRHRVRRARGGAGRPALPGRLPRHARRRGGPVHARRRRPGRARQAPCSATRTSSPRPPPTDVDELTSTGRRARWTEKGRDERDGRHPRHAPVAAPSP